MAQKKANGSSLVIIEVPKPLLATNFADLNQLSQSLFKQKAIRFDFSRDSDCSSKKLENIYHLFHDCMVQKNYLVTTGEAIASLELKYLELLSLEVEPEHEAELHQQIHWASRIINLLRQQGEAIIDEVHQALWIKKQLNYTVGVAEKVDALLITESLKYYQFCQAHPNERLSPEIEGPLSEIYQEYLRHHETITKFLYEEQELTIPEMTDEHKAILAIYKAQIKLLPQTITKKYREHYGPSKSTRKTALERCVCIPYSANEQASEQSEFAQPLETINYTIQSVFMDGLNPQLIQELFEDIFAEARGEMMQTGETSLNNTLIAREINPLLSAGLNLENINLKDEACIEQLHQHLSHHPQFIARALQNKILPQIRAEQSFFQSDCYQHVDCYHHVNGITGTPWNASTYHYRLNYNPQESLGYDGFIRQRLLEKETPLKALSADVSIDNLLGSTPDPKVHAIMDVGAIFKGKDNQTVAHDLKDYFKKQDATPIQFILYFNDDNVLCALSLETNEILRIGSSDPKNIHDKLGCGPEGYFCYYDQAHTVGTDIAQTPDAKALCLVDERTPLQSFLQAAMRMRQLSKEQSIEIFAAQPLMDSLASETEPTKKLLKLFAHFEAQEKDRLSQDHLSAALKQMKNRVRQELFNIIRSQDDVKKQQQYFQQFHSFFVQEPIQDIFSRYAGIEKMQDTAAFLKTYREELVAQYETLTKATSPIELLTDLEHIEDKYLPLCASSCKKTTVATGDALEVEQAQETELEQMQEQYLEIYDPSLKVKDYDYSWRPSNSKSLNTYLAPALQIFDTALKCSPNYIENHTPQKSFLNGLCKPVHSILFQSDDYGNLEAILLSEQDVEFHKHSLHQNQWIIACHGEVLFGSYPNLSIYQQEKYARLIEQSRFFGGHTKQLLEQTEPLIWLTEDAKQKIRLLQTHISPYRLCPEREIKTLQSLFSTAPKVIRYLNSHGFKDLRQVNWQAEFKDLTKAEIREITGLCQKIIQVHRQLYSLELGPPLENLSASYPKIQAWLRTHFDTLKELQTIIKKLLYDEMYAPTEADKLLIETLFTCHFDIRPSASIFYQKIQWLNALAAQTYLFEQFNSISPDLLMGFDSEKTFKDLLKEPSLTEEMYVLIFTKFPQFFNKSEFEFILSHISDEQLEATFLKSTHYLENYLMYYTDEIPINIRTIIEKHNLVDRINVYQIPPHRLQELKSFDLVESLRIKLDEAIENHIYNPKNKKEILDHADYFTSKNINPEELNLEEQYEENFNYQASPSLEFQDLIATLAQPIEDTIDFMKIIVDLQSFLKRQEAFTSMFLEQMNPMFKELSPELRTYLSPDHIELFFLVSFSKQDKNPPLDPIINIIRHTEVSIWLSYPVPIREELIKLTQNVLVKKQHPSMSLAEHSLFAPKRELDLAPLEVFIQELSTSLENPELRK